MGYTSVTLASRSNEARDTAAGSAKLVNCYVEMLGTDSKAETAVYACDGFSAFSTLTSGGVTRGMYVLEDTPLLWTVSGDNLYSVDTGGTSTNRESTLGLGASEVAYFARNTAATPDIMMVTSGGTYRSISGTTVSTPTYAAGIGAGTFNSVVGHENYFIFTKPNGEYYVSGVNLTTIDELDFDPGPAGLMRALVRGRDLVLMGTDSTEFLVNTGGADFPYQLQHKTNFGLYAAPCAQTVAASMEGGIADTIIWPATGPDGGYIGVFLLAGYDGRKISNHQVDAAVQTATRANLRAYHYTSNGHSFYAITDGATFTHELNTTTLRWNERTSSGLAFATTIAAAEFNAGVVFGDYNAGALYQSTTAQTPAAGSTVTVETSRDNGSTWATARTQTLGTSRTARTKFNSFGQSFEDGFQVRIKITSAYVENGNDIDITMIPPTIHATPFPVQLHTLYVDAIPGVGAGALQRGLIQIGADVERVRAA